MTNDAIFEKMREIFAEELDIDKEEVRPDSGLVSDIGLSSVELLMLIEAVEKAFSVRISEKMLRTFVTVQDLADCVAACLKGTAEE